MLRVSGRYLWRYRPYYNLATTTPGRMMTGFMTPYRHWMWKQNELWRNVHEAQFEHLRRVYKRQWLESFRVNADEYIYKYNITKAAQLAQWEQEMHEQEAKRKESLQTAQSRQLLKAKHLDVLREYHERHFFYWYERASERLQSMMKIQYVKPDRLDAHIEAELNKYVAGKSVGYPLNFVGQLPMLEDSDGNVLEVPAELLGSHVAERPGSTATQYQPPSAAAGDEVLRAMVSGLEETVLGVDGDALASAVEDIAKTEDAESDEVRVAKSMEDTEEEREIAKRKYIMRGTIGSNRAYRPARDGDDGGGGGASGSSSTSSPAPPLRKKNMGDQKQRAISKAAGTTPTHLSTKKPALRDDRGASRVGVGEVPKLKGRLRDRMNLPSTEELLSISELAAANVQTLAKAKNDPTILKHNRNDDDV